MRIITLVQPYGMYSIPAQIILAASGLFSLTSKIRNLTSKGAKRPLGAYGLRPFEHEFFLFLLPSHAPNVIENVDSGYWDKYEYYILEEGHGTVSFLPIVLYVSRYFGIILTPLRFFCRVALGVAKIQILAAALAQEMILHSCNLQVNAPI